MAQKNLSAPLFVGGVQVGLPGGSANCRVPAPGGQVWFVGNLAASTSLKQTFAPGNGETPDSALATLGGANGALAKLQNRKDCGDIIYILPGHVESVSAADYFSDTGTARGFSIIGLGSGTARGTFNWTAATSTWLIDTTGVEVANLNLNLSGNVAATTLTVTTPITISAAGCRIVDCTINWGLDTNTGCGSTLGAIAAVAATNLEFLGNRCVNLDTAGTLAVSFLSVDGCDNAQIIGNTITGGTTSTTVGSVHFVTTASLNVVISNNRIENLKASSTKALTSAIAGVTGTLEYNRLRVQSGIVGTTVASTPFLCSYFQNFTSDADTLNGALDVGAGTAT